MDIISMQIANKVLKRMNTEFNGAYDIFVATEGQRRFTTTKEHDTEGHTLHVYANGYHGVSGEDYTHIDNKTFEFTTGLRKGDVVLATTQVVGIPRFEVTNPEYDDTAVKGQIAIINNQISNIISAMDEDGDGSIIDTIADIKKQWADADSNIMKLIELKATEEDLQLLAARVEELAGTIPGEYDDTTIVGKITSIENVVASMGERVKDIEAAVSDETVHLFDEQTGRRFRVTLANGVIGFKPVGVPSELTHTAPAEVTIGIPTEFRLNVSANADLNQKVKLIVSSPNGIALEHNNGSAWLPFETQVIESLTNLGCKLRLTGEEIGNHEVSISIVKFDTNAQLSKATFSVEVKEAPHSFVSGVVTLNGANASNVLVSLQKLGDENGLATQVLEDGAYSLKTTEAGEYTVRVVNGTTTHEVVGLSEHFITVELEKNITGKNFELVEIIAPPVAEDFITWDEQIITTIPKGEAGDPPYQLMQINFNRLQVVDSARLDIVDATAGTRYHTTAGATSVNPNAMFQWSYRDLSALLEDESNLAELERTNTTLLAEGTVIDISITVAKDGVDYKITTQYTITVEDVVNATFEEVVAPPVKGGIE